VQDSVAQVSIDEARKFHKNTNQENMIGMKKDDTIKTQKKTQQNE